VLALTFVELGVDTGTKMYSCLNLFNRFLKCIKEPSDIVYLLIATDKDDAVPTENVKEILFHP
jgi:hypothetical protein